MTAVSSACNEPNAAVTGAESGQVLVVGWGSTYGAIAGAVQQLLHEGHAVAQEVLLRILEDERQELADMRATLAKVREGVKTPPTTQPASRAMSCMVVAPSPVWENARAAASRMSSLVRTISRSRRSGAFMIEASLVSLDWGL